MTRDPNSTPKYSSESILVPNFPIGTRVHLKDSPDLVGIVRSMGKGQDKIVDVYWGTKDGREFIGAVPSRQLVKDERPSKVNYS